MTENTQPAELVDPRALDPRTGELVSLHDVKSEQIADALDELGAYMTQVAGFRQALVEEVARRCDRRGARSVTLGTVDWEVNAPTVEEYDVDILLERMAELVKAGTIDQELVDELVPEPKPAPPPERKVDKRVANRLKKSTDRGILAALAAARTINDARRTAKVKARVEVVEVVEVVDA